MTFWCIMIFFYTPNIWLNGAKFSYTRNLNSPKKIAKNYFITTKKPHLVWKNDKRVIFSVFFIHGRISIFCVKIMMLCLSIFVIVSFFRCFRIGWEEVHWYIFSGNNFGSEHPMFPVHREVKYFLANARKTFLKKMLKLTGKLGFSKWSFLHSYNAF